MKNSNRSLYVALTIVLIIMAGWLAYKYFFHQTNWQQRSFNKDDKEPYGTYVISNLLKSYYPKKDFHIIQSPLSEGIPTDSGSLYVYLGYTYYPSDINDLLSFVQKGNEAFIANSLLNTALLDSLYSDISDKTRMINDEFVASNINLYIDKYGTAQGTKVFVKNNQDTIINEWQSFKRDSAELRYQNLGYIDNEQQVNFIKITYGKGAIYMHTTPLIFTNFHLLNDKNLQYAERVFSYLKPADIYWDEYSRNYHYEQDKIFNGNAKEGPLRYLLSQKSLRWAYYILLILLILYVLFSSKRKQRIIPVLAPKRNTSLEFVQTIGQMFYNQKDNKQLALTMYDLLYYFVKDRYQINLLQLTEESKQKLVLKSGVGIKTINAILAQADYVKSAENISDKSLTVYYNTVKSFYNKVW